MGFADADADDGWGVSSLFVVVVVVVRQVSYIFSLIFSLHFPYLRHRMCQAYKGGAKVKPVDYATLLCQPSHTHILAHTVSYAFSHFHHSLAAAMPSAFFTLPQFYRGPTLCLHFRHLLALVT